MVASTSMIFPCLVLLRLTVPVTAYGGLTRVTTALTGMLFSFDLVWSNHDLRLYLVTLDFKVFYQLM